jgi:hypothetical protein
MTEQELADQFGQYVDELLQGHCPDRASATPEYRHALGLAQALASTDLSVDSQQRAPLRHHLLSQIQRIERPASATATSVAALFTPWVRRVPAAICVVLAIVVIHLAWSGDLHRGATDLSVAFRESLQAAYASLPPSQPPFAVPITTTAGLAASPRPIMSGPEALATTQVPANSTTVALGNLVVFESPPK